MKQNRCSLCNELFADSELFCYTDDTSQVYNKNKFYCSTCYEKVYKKAPFLRNQTYKERILEDMLYFFPHLKDKMKNKKEIK